jgi:hypothetical protein
MSEIDELLEEGYREDDEITPKAFLITIGVMLAVIILFAPKIYIQNNIYYKSNKIQNDIYPTYGVLKEENNELKLKLEKEYLKNQTMSLEFR